MAELGTGFITIYPVFKSGIQNKISETYAKTGAEAGTKFTNAVQQNTAKVSSNLAKTGATAGASFSSSASSAVSRTSAAIANEGAKAGTGFFSRLRSSVSKIGSHFASIGQQSGSKFANETSKGAISGMGALGLASGMVLYRGIRGALNMVSTAIDSSISRVDTLRNFPKVMQGIGQSAEDSKAVIDDLSESLMGLPTTLDQAAQSVQRFTATNGDVKKSSQMFKALNNALIAGASSAELQSSALEQVTQAYSKGKMDMIEWRSLLQAAPAQVAQVAKHMGKSVDELGAGLRHSAGATEISMDEFMQAIIELDSNGTAEFESFSVQAQNAVGGIGTAIINVRNRMSKAVAAIIEGIDKMLTNAGLGTMAENINNLSTGIQKFGEKVGEVIGNIDLTSPFTQGVIAISGVLVAINSLGWAVQGVTTAFKPLTTVFTSIVSAGVSAWQTLFVYTDSTWGLISRAVGAKATAAATSVSSAFSSIVTPITGYFQSIGQAAAPMFAPIGQAFGTVKEVVVSAGAEMVTHFQMIGTNISTYWATAMATIEQTKAFQAVSSAASATKQVFVDFATTAKGAFSSVGNALVETFSPMASKIAGFLAPVGNTVKAALAPVGRAIKMAFTPGPLLAISVALTALGAIAVAVFKSTEEGGGGFMGFLSSIGDAIRGVVDAIGQGIAPAVEQVKLALQTLGEAFQPIITAIAVLGSQIVAAFTGGGEGGGGLTPIIDTLSTALSGVADFIRQIASVVTAAMPTILSVLQPVFDAVLNIVTNVLPPIMGLIQAIMGVVMSVLAAIMPPIMSLIGVIVEIYSVYIMAVIGVITPLVDAVMGFIGVIADALTPVVTGIGEVVSSVFSTIGSIIQGVIDFVTGIFHGLIQLLSGDASGAFNTFKDTVGNAINGVVDFFVNLPQNILNALGNVGTLLLDAGKKIIDGLLDGIKNAAEGLWNFVGGIADKIASLKGPLPYDRKLLIPAGKAIVEGLYNGLNDNIDTVYDLVGGIGDNIAESLDTEIQAGIEKATDLTIPVNVEPVGASLRAYNESVESHDIITNNYRINDLKINDSPEIARQFEKLFNMIIKKADMYA